MNIFRIKCCFDGIYLFCFLLLTSALTFVSCEQWNLERLVVDNKGELKIIESQAIINYLISDTTLTTNVYDTISLKNIGNGDLIIDFIESKHPLVYSIVWNGNDITIPPGSTKEVVIKFKPNEYAEKYNGHIVFSTKGTQEKDTLIVNGKAMCYWNCGGGNGCGILPVPVESIPYNEWNGCLGNPYVSKTINCGCGRNYGKIKARITAFDRNQGVLTFQWENCSSNVPFTIANLIATKYEGNDVETKFVSNIDVASKTVNVTFSFTPEFEQSSLHLIFVDDNNGVIKSYSVSILCIWF